MTDPAPLDVAEVETPGQALAVVEPTDVDLPAVPVDSVATAVASLGAKMAYATTLARSKLIPSSLQVWARSGQLDVEATAANVFLVMEYGQLLNLHPVTAMSEINVIKGKPGMSAKLMRAKVREAGHKLVTLTPSERRRQECTVQILLREEGHSPAGSEPFTFTLVDAVAQDLCKLNADGTPQARSKEGKALPWESIPDTMLLERATAKAVRGTCPEITMGIAYTFDELDAMAADAPPPPAPPAPVVSDDVPTAAWQRWAKVEVLKALDGDIAKAATRWAQILPGNPSELTEHQARAVVAAAAAPPDAAATPRQPAPLAPPAPKADPAHRLDGISDQQWTTLQEMRGKLGERTGLLDQWAQVNRVTTTREAITPDGWQKLMKEASGLLRGKAGRQPTQAPAAPPPAAPPVDPSQQLRTALVTRLAKLGEGIAEDVGHEVETHANTFGPWNEVVMSAPTGADWDRYLTQLVEEAESVATEIATGVSEDAPAIDLPASAPSEEALGY